jgi:hypothetical protein
VEPAGDRAAKKEQTIKIDAAQGDRNIKRAKQSDRAQSRLDVSDKVQKTRTDI